MLNDKRIVVTGGTGSLGKVLIHRLLSGEVGRPRKIIVFSRDEAKQHQMRVAFLHRRAVTDEVIYRNSQQLLEFRIGDVRDFHAISGVVREADVIFNAAALKQVPICEYFPFEAVQTNIAGPENIIRAIREHGLPVQTVVGISTDKACKPVNVMGMTKAIQERIFIRANLDCPSTRFVCVRYGNVLASRGSVVPLFHDQIRAGGPVTITTPEMTRFLLSLNQAVDLIFQAYRGANAGETFVPLIPAARMVDLASCLIGDRPIEIKMTGIRPGEKVHEILVSEEEAARTEERESVLSVLPIMPELRTAKANGKPLFREYSSADHLLTREEVHQLLKSQGLLDLDAPMEDELLR